jgi:hypothetical protein
MDVMSQSNPCGLPIAPIVCQPSAPYNQTAQGQPANFDNRYRAARAHDCPGYLQSDRSDRSGQQSERRRRQSDGKETDVDDTSLGMTEGMKITHRL